VNTKTEITHAVARELNSSQEEGFLEGIKQLYELANRCINLDRSVCGRIANF
jgi:hypothetical protein